MKYNGVIQRKLCLLDDQVVKLQKHLAGVAFKEFAESWMLRCMAERALQVSAEIIIDIAERIIAIENAGPVASASAAIDKLVDIGVLAASEPYRGIVKFRNLIVHQYEEADPEIVFSLATSRLGDFRKFRDEIDRQEENSAPSDALP